MNKNRIKCPELNCNEGTYVSPISGSKRLCTICNGSGYIYDDGSDYCVCGSYKQKVLPNNICRDCGKKIIID